jgi:peptidoglycan/LPS O-acetylase OafA/YrhL
MGEARASKAQGSATGSEAVRVRPVTLGERFDPRNNSLNALRLLLATLVIVSHAWPIGGFGPDPEIGGLGLGGWAVAGFFAISGYLITSSRLRSNLLPYLWRRFLRIFPGLWVCLLVIALVFAPVAALTQTWAEGITAPGLARYVITNGLFIHAQEGIASTLHGVPYANSWDGSLWTLRYEFGCYLLLGAAFLFPFIRRRPGSLAGLFAGCLLVTILAFELDVHVPATVETAAYLGTYFFAGSLLFVYAEKVRLNALVICAAVLWLAAAVWTGHVLAATALPLALLVMFLGATLPLQRIGRRNDISYGVYIYAFPVQQLLVLAGAASLGVGAFVVLGIAATLPLAAASWFVVERRAMDLKRVSIAALWSKHRRPTPSAPEQGNLATAEARAVSVAPPAQ